ncbi:MAG: hypothetical protein JWM44_835 [Bacilli bacterium]|nr:hypothetical protein [Bacilli bacterium]
MTDSQQIISLLFQELKETTKNIIALSLENEMSNELLNKYQVEQTEITHKIENALKEVDSAKIPIYIKQQVTECIDLEKIVKQKMLDYQSGVAIQLKSITNGSKVRGGYNNAFVQSDGYFIDKHN